jgi:hypothetical protein
MIKINKRIFIFGGFQEGGVLNDLYTLDMISFVWQTLKPEGKIISYFIFHIIFIYFILGPIPSPRQGMGIERYGQKIFVTGGCDYRLHKCFNDSFILDMESQWWIRIEN